MLAVELLAEKRIQEAFAQGEFDDLPGAGRPLALDDDSLVPEELRVAWRILRNAGFVPPEVEARREIAALERMVLADVETDGEARSRALRKLALLRTRIEPAYHERALRRLGR